MSPFNCHTDVDYDLSFLSSLEELPLISENSPWAVQMVDKIQSCKVGLRFLRMFFWSLLIMEDNDDAEIRKILRPVHRSRRGVQWGSSSHRLSIRELFAMEISQAEAECTSWIRGLQERIQYCKQNFEESCELLLNCSLRCKFSIDQQTLNFLDFMLENLKDLYKYKTDDEIVLLNNQIETLEKKLRLLRNLVALTPEVWIPFGGMRSQISFGGMASFGVVVQSFVLYSSNLIFLYWVKDVDEEMSTKLNLLLFDVLHKIKPCDHAFKAFYFRFLQEMKRRQLDSLLLGQTIQIFLDLLLESLVDILNDDFQILQESLMFVIAFLAEPPNQNAEDEELVMIIAEIEGLVKKDLYRVLPVNDMKRNSSEANACLSDFVKKVELVKGKIQQRFQDSFSYNFPKINGLGFFDFLLQNLGSLKEKLKSDTSFIPFAKHLIIKIEEELMSLRPYLDDLFEQQKEHKELKDIWLKVIDLAYRSEYAINSCSVTGYPLWYNMARLMEVLDQIKDINKKLKKIEGRKTHDGAILHCSAVAQSRVPEGPWASGFNEVMVGLKEEVDMIVENLVKGSKNLDIVAIVGMPGLGKTTMANKVYNAPAVRQHFHVFAYSIVSQVYSTRRILLDILGDIRGKVDNMYDMKEEELADMLRKCLLGRRYLIIMDDIWDVKSWDEVKSSLPNNQNGSRVIFTTRIHNVALQAKKDCILHHLRFLSEKESWELLLRKAFRTEACPPVFLEVGKMIAKNCNGLPLTIVLIGGLLAKTERSLSWWNKISETIGSYVSTEGGMDVLELSYQHLPEHLKSCLLYFDAFAEDTIIHVNKLTLLWITEGFVQNPNKENLKNVAKEYLCDLVDRSLVIANKRSSYGGIKSCRIHDLVHEFCQGKAQKENFFQLMDKYEDSNSSSSTVCNPYRACIHIKAKYLNNATKACPCIHTLIYSPKLGFDRLECPFVSNLKLVQVMNLEELEWGDACSISEIASLVHLRFIATSFGVVGLESPFPSSISNLWNLEILILTGIRVFPLELPGTIWNMTRLRHVDVGRCYLSSLGVKKGEAYPQMVNLESFSSPCISSTKDLEDLLQRSPSLKKLGFISYEYSSDDMFRYYFEEQKVDLLFPELDSLSKLESLKVSAKINLTVFKFPSNIKKLSLSRCGLDWKYLPLISKIPCLEVLKLLDNAFVGDEWDMEDTEFPKLKFLKLQHLYVAEWIAYGESFPSLEVLIVNRCGCLNIPPCFREMLTLKRIEFYGSPQAATSVVEIQESQKDLGNEELQVIVSDIGVFR